MAAIELLAVGLASSFLAATTDRRARQRERAAEAAYPPTGRILTVDGRRVHAHVEGTGPDLVLIHGASGNSRDFTFALAARLAPRYRVIAFDRPGFGWSDPLPEEAMSPRAQARHLRRAAVDLGLTRPLVLGQSYGGAVAMAWALEGLPRGAGAARTQAPDFAAPAAASPEAEYRRTGPAPTDVDAAALILVAAATMPWHGSLGAYYRLTGSTLGRRLGIPLMTAFASRARVAEAVTGVFAPDPAPSGYADYIGTGLTLRRRTMRLNTAQVNGLCRALEEMSPHYPGLTLPVEMIHGTEDATVPLHTHSGPLSRILPAAHLTTLPGAGHMPHHSRTEALLAAIDRAAARAGLR